MVGIPYCCEERTRVELVVKKAKHYSYLSSDYEHMHNMVESMESKLFNTVLSSPHHVLYQLPSPEKTLRQRSHSLTLSLEDNNLITKNFRDIYYRCFYVCYYICFIIVLCLLSTLYLVSLYLYAC